MTSDRMCKERRQSAMMVAKIHDVKISELFGASPSHSFGSQVRIVYLKETNSFTVHAWQINLSCNASDEKLCHPYPTRLTEYSRLEAFNNSTLQMIIPTFKPI